MQHTAIKETFEPTGIVRLSPTEQEVVGCCEITCTCGALFWGLGLKARAEEDARAKHLKHARAYGGGELVRQMFGQLK